MSVFADPPMDPRKAECVGHYLYGSGYFASEDVRTAFLRAEHAASFCSECRELHRCMQAHARQVRDEFPEQTEEYDRIVAEAAKRGIPESIVEAQATRNRTPTPYQVKALANFRRGRRHRARSAGPVG